MYQELSTQTAEEILQEASEDPGVLITYLQGVLPTALSFCVRLVIAVVILLVGMKIIKSVVKVIEKSMRRRNVEPGVLSFLCSLIKYSLYFVLIMLLLGGFGITTGSVVAVLGSAGLTLGLALQGSLTNFAGGVLLLLLKPFKVGDYIITDAGGKEGTVSDITIFYTKVNTIDNKVIMIPNGALSNSTITNVSQMETRRLDLLVGVAYDSDLSKVKAVLAEIAKRDEAVLREEPVDVFVSNLADSAVEMGLRVWVKNEDYWTAKWRITEQIKKEFDENGISIPFPQMDIHTKME